MKHSRRITQLLSQSFFCLLVFGLFLSSPVLTMGAPGDLDTSFNANLAQSGSPAAISAIVVQPDGKILIGGSFNQVAGVMRQRITRLNFDGSLDTTFNVTGIELIGLAVDVIALQSDGKILLSGFANVSGVLSYRVVRLNADGSLDNSFSLGSGTNNPLKDIVIQPDGKILVSGSFTSFNGVSRSRIVRLNANGSVDSFNSGEIIGDFGQGQVNSIALQPDGKILIVGSFTSVGGVPRRGVARLNSDGSLDNSFNVGTGVSDANGQVGVNDVILQPDGKILIGGGFNTYNGVSSKGVARLNTDGSLDTTFNFTFINGNFPDVRSLALQSNGKIIVGGAFNFTNIVRLNADGSRDTTFTATTSNTVERVVLQSDGKILIGGSFTTVNNTTRNAIARLLGDAVVPRRPLFDFDGDGKADQAVFRSGIWYLLRSSSGFAAVQFGSPTDRIAPADFDGDGRTDIAVFRDGVWYWLNSSNGNFNAVQFGTAGDVPVPADYTGDGRAEVAVFRGGFWYTLNLANNQFQAVQFGISSDKPVPADFDADGKTDFAVYRDGVWYLLRSTAGFTGVQFGIASDKPTVGDYDGDGRADQAVFRSGVWYILGSTQGFYAVQFGVASDIPVAADYDGDGKTDVAVFRDGIWYMQRSQQGFGAVQFGTTNDRPIPAAFVP